MRRTGLALVIALAIAGGLPITGQADDTGAVIELNDGAFIPSRLEVAAAGSVRIVLRNSGKQPAEFESRALRKELLIPAGAETAITLRSPARGTYDFFDDFHPDAAKGVIVVK